MNKIILSTILLVCIGCSPKKNILNISNKVYKLAFFDDFKGERLDTSMWEYRTDSKHWSTQLANNVEIKNGFLYLNLKKEKALDKDYTGAGIISKSTFRYGYYEAKLKIPEGTGWHTSFWLMRYNDSSAEIEIDIFENDSKHPDSYEIALHTFPGGHVSVFGQTVQTSNINKEFVVLACEYTPNYVKYYMNGKEVKNLDTSNFPKGPVNIKMTSIASWLGGTKSVDDTKLPSTAIFDYVKYYKLN